MEGRPIKITDSVFIHDGQKGECQKILAQTQANQDMYVTSK